MLYLPYLLSLSSHSLHPGMQALHWRELSSVLWALATLQMLPEGADPPGDEAGEQNSGVRHRAGTQVIWWKT